MRFWTNVLFLIFASIVLSSCSRIDIAIKWADTFLYYELKSVFDFEGKQKLIAESSSNSIVAEMKKNWLPSIALRFQKLSEKVDTKDKKEIEIILKSEMEFIQNHLGKLYKIVANEIPNVGQTMTENNWTHFKEEFEEKNKDILSEKPKNKIQDNIENFIGRLSKEQKDLVRSWINLNPPNPELRVENRRFLINEINLKIVPWSSEKWSETVLSWLKDPKAMNLASYETYIQKRTESVIELLVNIFATMSDEQRKKLRRNLLDWQEKLG